VSCTWTKLRVENIFRSVCRLEDLTSIAGCTVHRGCKGHHMIDADSGIFMIPYGFSTGDELRYSDGAVLNTAVCNGTKTAEGVANFCFSRIKGKHGILRKHCNSTRPTNSMRFVASPSKGPEGTILLPNEVFDKDKFLFQTRDGRFEIVGIEEGDVVIPPWSCMCRLEAPLANLICSPRLELLSLT
jgi:hypothetical protein